MKKTRLFSFEDKDTIIHRLSGLTKLICFLLLTFAAMFTYDIRVLVLLTIFSLCLAKISKLSFRRYRIVVIYLMVFMIINMILNFIFAPNFGPEIFGTRHEIFAFAPNYVLTVEQLFYQLCKAVKYICIMPLGLLFFATIEPSEFASSLNGIKIPYKVCTVFSLALRYFPDIQRDYTNISLAQQARGVDVSAKASLKNRIRNNSKVLLPLIFSTLDRVELITNAMELRGYGKYKNRTWYSFRPLIKNDYFAIGICVLIFTVVLVMRFCIIKSMYFNPFI